MDEIIIAKQSAEKYSLSLRSMQNLLHPNTTWIHVFYGFLSSNGRQFDSFFIKLTPIGGRDDGNDSLPTQTPTTMARNFPDILNVHHWLI